MAIDIFDHFKKIQKDMLRVFETAFSSEFKRPLSDITQNKKEVIVNIKLPGIRKKDIVMNIRKERIEIRAEVKKKKVKKTKKKISNQESYKGFYRKISLPGNLDIDKVRTSFKRNTLCIRIPKLKIKKLKTR